MSEPIEVGGWAEEPEPKWPMPVSFNNFDDKVSRTLFAITRDGLVLVREIPRSDPEEKDALWVREDGMLCVSRGKAPS